MSSRPSATTEGRSFAPIGYRRRRRTSACAARQLRHPVTRPTDLARVRAASVRDGFAEALAGGLLADAEYRGDLSPGPSMCTSLGHLVGQGQVAGCDGAQRLADRAQIRSV